MQEVSSVEQIKTFLRAQKRVKFHGTRRCFNSIADSKYNLLSLKPMLPHIPIAGSCSTGTYGSGEKVVNLSTAVAALEFVTAGR